MLCFGAVGGGGHSGHGMQAGVLYVCSNRMLFVLERQVSIFCLMIDNNLKMLCWNVRGLNSPARRETVSLLLHEIGVNIVCLQETKLQLVDDALALETLGQRLNSSFYLPADGTRGGILIGWDKDLFEISNPSFGQHSISVNVTSNLASFLFRLTVVYGPSEDPDKEAFLNELLTLKPAPDTPWLCVGDFNLIHSAADKNNLSLNRRLMGRFRNILDACELLELSLHNRKYTWSNGQLRPTLVRLD